MASKHVTSTWLMLKMTYGVFFLAVGVDKFFNMITMWSKYASPVIMQYIPLETSMIMMIIGVIEVLVGAAILTNWTEKGAQAAGVMLLICAANLATMGTYFDVAARDVVMAMGAFALACLTHAKD